MPTKIEDQQTSRTDALLSKAVVEKKQGQSLKDVKARKVKP